MKAKMVVEIKKGVEDFTMESDEIEGLPCVKCLMRPICSNTPANQPIKCPMLSEFILKYTEGIDIKVTDLVSAPLQKQLLYIYNKINDGS